MKLKDDKLLEMSELFIAKADRALQSARSNLEEDPATSINRSYYSMFYAAQGALALKGVADLQKHKGVIGKFGECFVCGGEIDKKIGKSFVQVENARYQADYDITVHFSPKEAGEQLQKAEIFVAAVLKTIQKEMERGEENGRTGQESRGAEIETQEPKISREEGPNMAEIQSAELKASLVQGLDKSADGNTHVEGQDIGYAEEGYVAAANEVKYEAQRARTADGEAKNRGLENPQVGQRVTFHAHGSEVKLTGNVVSEDKDTVTMKCGNKEIPTARGKGIFTEAPPLAQNHTKEYAKEQAQQHVGEKGKVFFAQTEGAYKGTIVGKTPTFAIQKVNAETAILHRLKDLEAKDKDSQGLIQEGKDVSIVKDGRSVSIAPYDREREEKDKVREQQKSRGSQSL